MGERYDMNYIYYNTGTDAQKNWHGAEYYYEYPNVFADVLIHDYCGINSHEKADLSLIPSLSQPAKVKMESYGIEYSYTGDSFTIKNTGSHTLNIYIDLSNIFDRSVCTSDSNADNGIYKIPSTETIVFKKT